MASNIGNQGGNVGNGEHSSGGGGSETTVNVLAEVIPSSTQTIYTFNNVGQGTEIAEFTFSHTPTKAGNKLIIQIVAQITINTLSGSGVYNISRNGSFLPYQSNGDPGDPYYGIGNVGYWSGSSGTPATPSVLTCVDENTLDIASEYKLLLRNGTNGATYSAYLNRIIDAPATGKEVAISSIVVTEVIT